MKIVDVCNADALPENCTRAVRVEGIDILLCNVGGELHAVENSCLHQGAALGGGRLDGRLIACPAHGWRYDVTTGELAVAPGKKLRTFKVARQEQRLTVAIDDQAPTHLLQE